MFWRWWAPWDFMNTEPGQHESQFNALSQRLFGLTFWGDYGGDIISRYHYSMLLEEAPLVVGSIDAMHGQGLVLVAVEPDNEEYRDQLREVIRFLAYFDPDSKSYGGYPLYDESGFSDWEWHAIQKEMTEGWWAEYERGELAEQFEDWEDNTIVPEVGSDEWGQLLADWDEEHQDGDYPYWEGADSLIVTNWDAEKVAAWLLDRYARSITEAGNPTPLEEV